MGRLRLSLGRSRSVRQCFSRLDGGAYDSHPPFVIVSLASKAAEREEPM